MKSYIKNLIGILAVVTILICGANSAYADVSFSPSSPQQVGISIEFACSVGNTFVEYDHLGNVITDDWFTCPSTLDPLYSTTVTAGTDTFVECDSTVLGNNCQGNDATLTLARADTGYVSDAPFTFTNAPSGGLGLLFFGGESSATMRSPLTNSAFVANVASAFGTTQAGFFPIVALIAGFVLALILIKKVLSMFKQTGNTGTKSGVKNATALHRKNMGLWVRE